MMVDQHIVSLEATCIPFLTDNQWHYVTTTETVIGSRAIECEQEQRLTW